MTAPSVPIFDLQLYLWCVAGIIISIVLPPLWAYVKEQFAPPAGAARGLAQIAVFWPIMKPYLALGVVSAVTALLLVMLLGDTIADPKAALLTGYAWDSTLQKFRSSGS